jgi:RNA-binding protein YlmH
MDNITKEEQLFRNRISELASRSYGKGIYTFTDFLSLSEQSTVLKMQREIGYAHPSFFGGADFCERRMLRFGCEDEMGYEEPYPICVIEVSPAAPAFASLLTHRDFLGAILNLGVERAVTGDIAIDRETNTAYVFCLESISEFLAENLVKVKRENVKCRIIYDLTELPSGIEPHLLRKTLSVASERVDAVISAAWNVSRTDSADSIRAGLVFINQRICTSPSESLKAGDLVSLRGKGRFIYLGVNYVSRKGRDNVSIDMFV